MLKTLKYLGLVTFAGFALSACGTLTTESQIQLNVTDPVWSCYVDVEQSGNEILFTTAGTCGENRAIPFSIEDEDGLTVYDGGVYGDNTTEWNVGRYTVGAEQSETFTVVHGNHGGTIATIKVE